MAAVMAAVMAVLGVQRTVSGARPRARFTSGVDPDLASSSDRKECRS
ncbi:MAG: hypothetical protein QNL98_01795 [Mycobacterium sp.]